MVQKFNTILRDYETDGVPSSGAHEVDKAQFRAALTAVETGIAGAAAGATIYDSKADMDADTSQAANAMAWVLGDPVAANNGVYQFNGTAWIRLGDLPYSYITASNAGAGTANAIVATTSIPIPAADGAALVALPIVADNTASPVTVAFNGGSVLTIKTNAGNAPAVGGLKAGMIVAGYVSGSTFRLLSDQASAAIQAAAEAAQAAAEAAAASIDYITVADRTALKAVDTASHTVVYLKEAGREGNFKWDSSDLSAKVTIDTAEGIYVAPASDATGASGAWVRQFYGPVSVGVFGAPSGTDDTAVFKIASSLAQLNEYQIQQSTVLKAPVKYVRVPAGIWNVTGPVPSTAMVIWMLDDAADIVGAEYLTGTLVRPGRHVNAKHSGIWENAQTLGVRAGRSDLDETGGVYGILTLDTISKVGPPHSVTLQIDADTQVVPIELTGTVYTAISVTYTNIVDLGDVKVGASITSIGSPTMTGIITAVDEATNTITLAGGWRPFTGVSGSTGTPTNGDPARIDYFDKIWGQNTNVILRPNHPTEKAAGYEMGVLNNQADVPVLDPGASQKPSIWGFDAVNLGPFKASVGHIARGGATAPFRTGFAAYGTEIGFATYLHSTHANQVGFSHEAGQGTAFRALYNGAPSFSVSSQGQIELGRNDAAAAAVIDFHTSGVAAADYDARILASGGDGTNGEGILTYTAAAHRFVGSLSPNTDIAASVGGPNKRFNEGYIKTLKLGDGSPIWTSGAGSPEGVVNGAVGSLYARTDGEANATLYVKETGTGNTGWVAK